MISPYFMRVFYKRTTMKKHNILYENVMLSTCSFLLMETLYVGCTNVLCDFVINISQKIHWTQEGANYEGIGLSQDGNADTPGAKG